MIKRIMILSLLLYALGMGATTGKIAGIILDADTGEPLPGANVIIEGTALGAATDIEGVYFIVNIPAGAYQLRILYIGYEEKIIPVEVKADQVLQQDAELSMQVFEGETVVVTALLEGQARAINQQLSSNTIVNIVSSDKIQELPDQNAAESLGRLPGIAVQRDAGEGQKIVVRGLAPKFNSVTVNGERIPSTDVNDRSVDLSMISGDMLAGIEVFKSLTPDKDADAIGGTVNFVIKKAKRDWQSDIRFQSGYNDHAEDFGLYKGTASVSNRFFNNTLGILLTGSLQKANRSSHLLDSDYLLLGEAQPGQERAPLGVNHLNLADRIEIRDRYGASLTLDYDLPAGSIMLNSFWAKTDRDELRRRRRYNIDANRTEFTMRDRDIDISLWSNSLSGEYAWGDFNLFWRGSTSISEREMPFSHYVRFYETSGFSNDLIDNQGPELIPLGAENDLDDTWFKYSWLDDEKISDRDYTAQLDLKWPFTVSTRIAGYLKAGGKIRDKSREVDKNTIWSNHFGINEVGEEDIENRWLKDTQQRLKVINFLDPDFEVKDYLDGKYTFGQGLDVDKINAFYEEYKDYRFDDSSSLYIREPLADLADYSASEQIIAGYFMAEVNVSSNIMILPGFRYEKTINDYKSIFGTPQIIDEDQSLGGLTDTSGYRKYDHILPMIQARYKPWDWFDIRTAVTKTISRPDYFNLVPYRREVDATIKTIEEGNPNLKPTLAWNYDLFLSFYNKYGLFTIGGFIKDVSDIDYLLTRRIRAEPESYMLVSPVNSEYLSKVRGFEIEIQTNLRMLPSPFDGLIIYANYSHMKSETPYPYLKVDYEGPPFFRPIFTDTVRIERMPGQADDLFNFTLGYEKGGFTGRISIVYQGESLVTIGNRRELDGYTDAFTRVDIAMQQELGFGLNIYANFNNITSRPEESYLSIERFPTRQEYFGWTADLGLRYKF